MIYAFIISIGLFFGSGTAHAEDSEIAEASDRYNAGDFEGASRLVNILLVRDQSFSRIKRAELYLMKARIEFAFNRAGESTMWLRKAHVEDATLTLDPVKDPPPLVTTWSEISQESDELPIAAPAEQLGSMKVTPFVPFGVPQLQLHEPYKALTLAAVHASLLAGTALSRDTTQRHIFIGLFAITWSYSILDASSGKSLDVAIGKSGSTNVLALSTSI